MKTIGIVGGLGPESTIEYYRFLIAAYQERQPDGSFPSIIINSLDLQRGLALVTANQLDELAAFLADGVESLARAGASFGLMAANTPHIVFDEVQRRSPIPLLSIVEAAREAAQQLSLTRLALLGTGFTMKGRFYPEVFSPRRHRAHRPHAGRSNLHSRQVHQRAAEEQVSSHDARCFVCDPGEAEGARSHRRSDPGGHGIAADSTRSGRPGRNSVPGYDQDPCRACGERTPRLNVYCCSISIVSPMVSDFGAPPDSSPR